MHVIVYTFLSYFAVLLTTNVWKTSNVLYVHILLMFYSANLQIKYLQVLWPPLMMCHQPVLTGHRPGVGEQLEFSLASEVSLYVWSDVTSEILLPAS